MELEADEVIEPAPEPRRPVAELVRERALTRVEAGRRALERAVEAPAALGLEPRCEGDAATGAQTAQSSIPLVGEDGTAISRAGMRPAR
jgi:hypothetical protein